jgi:hypothetical protein
MLEPVDGIENKMRRGPLHGIHEVQDQLIDGLFNFN